MSDDDFKSYTSLGDSIEGERERRALLGKTLIPFSIPFLDDSLGGICRDDLVLIGGRSGGGKSEIALHVAMSAALMGKKVFYFGLEFACKELERRVLYKKLTQRFFNDPDKRAGVPDFQSWMLGQQDHLFEKYYDDEIQSLRSMTNLLIRNRQAEFTLDDFERNIISEKDCDLFVVDHLHYFDVDFTNKENEAMSRIIKTIRSNILAYDRPVVLVSHIRKADPRGNQLCPSQEDFHGSSEIYKNATRAITISPVTTDFHDPTVWPTYIWAVKNRFGNDRARYIATVGFCTKKNSYLEGYKLQLINPTGTKATNIDRFKIPNWAKGYVP